MMGHNFFSKEYLSCNLSFDFQKVLMEKAIHEAKKAFLKEEIPIGALLYFPLEKKYFAFHNETQSQENPLCHGEFLAIQRSLREKMGPYLSHGVLYVTLQPCIFCQEAIKKTRIPQVYFGAYQYEKPFFSQNFHGNCLGLSHGYIEKESHGHYKTQGQKNFPGTIFSGGFYESACRDLLQKFFQNKRLKKPRSI